MKLSPIGMVVALSFAGVALTGSAAATIPSGLTFMASKTPGADSRQDNSTKKTNDNVQPLTKSFDEQSDEK